MTCKGCGREAKMYWRDKEKRNGRSETFFRNMCQECYTRAYGKEPKTLYQLNEERRQMADRIPKQKNHKSK